MATGGAPSSNRSSASAKTSSLGTTDTEDAAFLVIGIDFEADDGGARAEEGIVHEI